MQEKKAKLTNFGYNFQVKLITCLLTDIQFSSRVYDILKPEYFSSDELAWVCETILQYYQTYHTMATMEVLKYEIDKIDDVDKKTMIVKIIHDAITFRDGTDLVYIKESTISFCKNQELTHAIYESVELLKHGKYDDIKRLVDDALKKGDDQNVGHDYLIEVDERYEGLSRKPITTGWKVVDELMQGGLSAGELGVIVGPGGTGKSWILSKLCTSAMDAGYKCLFITLELSKEYVGIRMDCIMTNINMSELKQNRETIKNRLRMVTGDLKIEWYPTKKLSMMGLRALLDRMILLDKKPDIMFLDYADLMSVGKSSQKRKDEELQELYEELRGTGGEYQIPIWTASQANRSSHDEGVEYVSAGMISESMGKHFTADFMMSILRREREKNTNTAIFHIIKNRLGEDGVTLLSHMDTGHGIIDIFKPNGTKHKEIENLMIEDETNVKKKLTSRRDAFFKEGEAE